MILPPTAKPRDVERGSVTRSSLARCKRSGLSGNVVKIRTCCGSQSRAPDRGSVTRGDADVATVLRVGDPRSGGSGKMRPKCIGKKNYLCALDIGALGLAEFLFTEVPEAVQIAMTMRTPRQNYPLEITIIRPGRV